MEFVKPNSEQWLNLDDLPNERWKDIEGYEGLYQVSDYGRVKSLYKKIDKTHVYKCRILKQSSDKDGYLSCTLCKNNVHNNIRVHTLVGKHFVPNPDNKPIFDHLDEVEKDYCNNHYLNLSPATYSENTKRAYRRGRKVNKPHSKKGADSPCSRKVVQFSLDMEFIKTWDSIGDVCREYNFSHGNIVSCCKGNYKQAYNYIWRYYEEVKDEMAL